MILQICVNCKKPITDDPKVARERAVCRCEKSKEGLFALIVGEEGIGKK